MLYSKILVAYDGSEASEKALDSALKLSKLNHYSKLDIIYIYHYPVYLVGTVTYSPPLPVEADYTEEVMNKIKQKITDFSNTHIEIRKGSPAKTILAYAEETKSDLIVIGSRGLNALNEFVLGSVSHNVVQHARIPVLVIK